MATTTMMVMNDGDDGRCRMMMMRVDDVDGAWRVCFAASLTHSPQVIVLSFASDRSVFRCLFDDIVWIALSHSPFLGPLSQEWL